MAAESITNGYGRECASIFEDPRLSVPISFAVSPDVLKYDGASADDAYFDQTAFRLWPLSLTLCRWLCAHPEIVRGKRVVELGAGFGALGLVCAALGAAGAEWAAHEGWTALHFAACCGHEDAVVA